MSGVLSSEELKNGFNKSKIWFILLMLFIIFEAGIYCGFKLCNTYYDHRIKDSLKVGSFLYTSIQNGEFDESKKMVYLVRPQVIDVYVPSVEKKK